MAENVTVPPFDTAPETVVGSTPQSVFPFEFPFWEAADVLVYVGNLPLSITAYDVEGFFVQNGEAVEGGYGSGQVTLNTPVSNVTVTIDRYVAGERESQFSRASPLGMPSLNSDLNKVTARAQDLARQKVTRPFNRANKVLGFDADGNEIAAEGVAPTTSFTAPLLTTTSAAAFRIAIGAAKQFQFDVTEAPYNAVGNGSVDDTAAIQAALNDAAVVGGLVRLPRGEYKISDELDVKQNTSLVGVNQRASILKQVTLNKRIVKVTGVYATLSDFSVIYDGAPASGAIAIHDLGLQTAVERIIVFNGYVGMRFGESGNLFDCLASRVKTVAIFNCVSIGVHLWGTLDFFMDSFVIDAGTDTNCAIGTLVIEDGNEAFLIANADTVRGVHGLVTKAATYAAAQRPGYGRIENIFFDSAAQDSTIDDLVKTYIARCWWSGGRTGPGYPGWTLGRSHSVTFAHCDSFVCGAEGGVIKATAINAVFDEYSAVSNCVTSAGGTKNGLQFEANATGSVRGGRTGNGINPLGLTGAQGYGLGIASNCGVQVDGMDLSGNLTGPVNNASANRALRIINCPGYNPGGVSTMSPGASPWTYQAGPALETIYIRSGTVSNISLEGVTVATATNTVLQLGPGEQAVITYSSVPTMVKSMH